MDISFQTSTRKSFGSQWEVLNYEPGPSHQSQPQEAPKTTRIKSGKVENRPDLEPLFVGGNGPFPPRPILNRQEIKELKKLQDLRVHVVGERVRLSNTQEDCIRQRKHTRASEGAFIRASDAFMSRITGRTSANGTSFDVLQLSWQELQQSTTRLASKEQQVKSLERAMNVLEMKLKEQEERLYLRLKKILVEAGPSGDVAYGAESYSTSSSSTTSSRTTPSLVRQFYKHVGDAKLLHERLTWLDAEHQREVAKRVSQLEKGESCGLPERTFLERYFEARVALIRDLSEARNYSYRLKEQCQAKNLSIEESSEHSGEQEHLDRSRRDHSHVLFFNSMPQVPFDDLDPLELFRMSYTDAETRVSKWLANVPRYSVGTPNTENTTARALFEGKISPVDGTESGRKTTKVAEELQFPDYGLLAPDFREHRLHRLHRHNDYIDEFQGEAPKRRYSEPCLSDRYFSVLRKSYLLLKKPRSQV
jgi:hypothetical protein